MVSSKAMVASQACGTCGVTRKRSRFWPSSSTEPSTIVFAGRSNEVVDADHGADLAVDRLSLRRYPEEFVQRAALTGFQMSSADAAQVGLSLQTLPSQRPPDVEVGHGLHEAHGIVVATFAEGGNYKGAHGLVLRAKIRCQ